MGLRHAEYDWQSVKQGFDYYYGYLDQKQAQTIIRLIFGKKWSLGYIE